MTELHYDNIFGTASVGSITLSAGGTTASFSGAPIFPSIGGGDFAKIVVEPDSPNEEIIHVTAYTAGGTTATVTRGQEGTTAIAHTAVAWVHGPTAANVSKVIAGTNVSVSDDGMGNVTVNAAGGGGGGAMSLISSQLLVAPAASITFSSIPGTSSHLRLIVVARLSGAVMDDFIDMIFNADAAAHYDRYQAATFANAVSAAWIGYLPGASATANVAGRLQADIPLYAGTTFEKVCASRNEWVDHTATGRELNPTSTAWRSTAAITSITLTPHGGSNFVTGSAAYLYGIT